MFTPCSPSRNSTTNTTTNTLAHSQQLSPTTTTSTSHHPANLPSHIHPLVDYVTPSSISSFYTSMFGVRVSVYESDKVLIATALDRNTGKPLDSISVSFPPPPPPPPPHHIISSSPIPSIYSTTTDLPWVSHLSHHLRKRKRSVGSTSSAGLDFNDTLSPMTQLTYVNSIPIPHSDDSIHLSSSSSSMVINNISTISDSITSPPLPLIDSPTISSDHMDIDPVSPLSVPTHNPISTIKPVKKRAKSIDTTNSHLSLLMAASSSSNFIPTSTSIDNNSHSTTSLPPSLVVHSPSATHLGLTSALNQSTLSTTTMTDSTSPLFPPSPIHSPSHTDVPPIPNSFCDTPPGSGTTSPLTSRISDNSSLVPFRDAPMTPADEPSYISTHSFNNNNNNLAHHTHMSVLTSSTTTSGIISNNPALARIHNLSKWVTELDDLPEPIIHYALLQILKRCNVTTLQFVHGIVSPALKRDFLALLPYEIAANILQRLDYVSLCRSARVSRRWRTLIDSDTHLWRTLGAKDGFWALDCTSLPNGSMLRIRNLMEISRIQLARQEPLSFIAPDLIPFLDPSSVAKLLTREQQQYLDPRNNIIQPQAAHPFKSMYARGRTLQNSWMNNDPKMITFTGHGSAVVTCLQFDEDKVVSGSDDQTICVYDIRTGALRMRLEGHEGGVWALQYVGNTLVSGSTDRTVRVWDLRTGRTTHVFHGHTSTVRCLQLLLPVPGDLGTKKQTSNNTSHMGTNYRGGYISSSTYLSHQPTPYLNEPLIVTGSRDTHLRVWRLPELSDTPWPPITSTINNLPSRFPHRSNDSNTGTPGSSIHDLTGEMDNNNNMIIGDEDIINNNQMNPTSSSASTLTSNLPDTNGNNNNIITPLGTTTSSNSVTNNPYFRHVLTGHSASVRALAGHGHIVCSGSYDCTVHVWDVVKGVCLWQLTGHTNKVYSIVYDGKNRCWSGAMDSQVRCWDINTGTCIAVLEGHTSLVGLLEINPNWLISAAADSTLRVWDIHNNTNSLLHTLQAHTNAITCFHFDKHKIVSGSEGAIKLWNPYTGKVVRDLVTGITSVWRLQVNERYCVAAVNRDARTEFLVLDFDTNSI